MLNIKYREFEKESFGWLVVLVTVKVNLLILSLLLLLLFQTQQSSQSRFPFASSLGEFSVAIIDCSSPPVPFIIHDFIHSLVLASLYICFLLPPSPFVLVTSPFPQPQEVPSNLPSRLSYYLFQGSVSFCHHH